MKAYDFFNSPKNKMHKKYEALRAFCYERKTAQEIAKRFGYTKSTIYSLVRDFKQQLQLNNIKTTFFTENKLGRKPSQKNGKAHELILLLRKKFLSVCDIKVILDAQNYNISERHIFNIIKADGFARLPRRDKEEIKDTLSQATITAPKSIVFDEKKVCFSTQIAGILCFLIYVKKYNIDQLINSSNYPGTKALPKLNSILAFLALKLSNFSRYSADDVWCMDRGIGIFAGLNVLPKAAWFSSYSSRVTRDMNIVFLRSLNKLWGEHNLLSDTTNLDFTAIPYWGEEDILENNWCGKRNKSLLSILAAVGQDPDLGIITYGDTSVRHDSEKDVVIEFLDFYRGSNQGNLKYLVFDSKFTTYENLRKLDEQEIKFITIRRRGKRIVEELDKLSKDNWTNIRVKCSKGKTRELKVIDQTIFLKVYNKDIRQIVITGNGKIKPALIISNDFTLKKEEIVYKYARRWLVEKTISEQTYFFHLNQVSSSMVIKVDFDLTMTILAYNLYRLFSRDLEGFKNATAQTLYNKFVNNGGVVNITESNVKVLLKKKRNLPALLTLLSQQKSLKIPWLGNRNLNIEAAAYT
jgi:transposase